MADVYSVIGSNAKKHVIANGTNGRTLIVKISKANITDAELFAWTQYMTTSHGVNGSGDSAFTVAGVGTADGSAFAAGVTDVVYVALQGTGTLTVASVEALTGSPTVTIEAVLVAAK